MDNVNSIDNMEIIETYEEKINYEVENIINKYWSFLHENWNIINFKYKHTVGGLIVSVFHYFGFRCL